MVHPPRRHRFAWSGRWTRLLGLVGLTLLLASCSFIEIDSPLTIFKPKGPIADRINGLFWPVFWIATGIFVLVQGLILFSVIAFRDREGRKEPKQVHGNPILEVTWTVIPTLILAGIAIPTVRAVFDLTGCNSNDMQIEVYGHQWWFEYRYPDYGITTANVMVIPAGEEVCAVMTSEDVIHNFWVPALNGKRYLIPGQQTELRLAAYQPGEFWGHCAEFCGLSHSLMRARVQAMNQEDFDNWVKSQQQPAAVPAAGTPAAQGWDIFNQKCTACHDVTYTDTDGTVKTLGPTPDAFHAPNLTHFASRDVFAGASLPYEGITREQALTMWLSDPPKVKPGSYMPNLNLTQDEIDALIAWLETMK